MKIFTENRVEQAAFAQKVWSIFSENPALSQIMQSTETMDGTIGYFERLMQKSGKSEDSNSVENQIRNRLQNLSSAITAIRHTSDPEDKTGSMVWMAEKLNAAMGGIDNTPTLETLTTELFKKNGYESLEDPNFNFLFQLPGAFMSVENLSQIEEQRTKLNQIQENTVKQREDSAALQKGQESLIAEMYELDNSMTKYRLDAAIKETTEGVQKAQDKLDVFLSPNHQQGLEQSYAAAKKARNEYVADRNAKQEKLKTLQAREKYIFSESPEGFTFNRLTNDERAVFEDLENKVQSEDSRIDLLNQSIQRHNNIDTDIQAAEKKIRDAEKDIDTMMQQQPGMKEKFQEYRAVQEQVRSAGTALELIQKCRAAQEQGKLFPALVSMGLVSISKGKPMAKKISDMSREDMEQYPEYKAIATDYLNLRNAVIACAEDKPAAEAFFKELDTSQYRMLPMARIESEFISKCEQKQAAGSETLLSIGTELSKFLMDPEVANRYNTLTGTLYETTGLLETLRQEKKMFTPRKELEDSLKQSLQRKADLKDSLKKKTNGYLKTFGAEPVEEPLSYPELLQVGAKAVETLKSEMEDLSSVNQTLEMNRTLNKLDGEIKRFSAEARQETENNLRSDLKDKRDLLQKLTKMNTKYGELEEKYDQVNASAVQNRKDCREMLKASNYSQLGESFQNMYENISSVTRLGGHSDSKLFTDMKNALKDAKEILTTGTEAQKLAKLKDIRDLSQVYINEKKNQFRPFASTMRKTRLDFAEKMHQMSADALKQSQELHESEAYRTAARVLTERPISNQPSFHEAFKRTQEIYAAKQKVPVGSSMEKTAAAERQFVK